MKTTCKECGAELEITDERTFVKCSKCGTQTIVDVAPPWALAGLDYVAPPPPTGGATSEPPPPPLRHDHAPASHRAESLSPLSGELVEGDDLIYATCENCGKEFEGNASFLRCPFCGVTNTVDTAPPWAISGDLLQDLQTSPSSPPPPPPQRRRSESPLPPAGSAEMRQEWRSPEVASHGGTARSSGGSGMLVGIAVAIAVGVGGFVMFAASEQEEVVIKAPAVKKPQVPDLDIDRVEQEIEGVVNAGATAEWSCEKAEANYQAHRDPDIKFEPVPEGVFGEVLNDGPYLKMCAVPDTTRVDVCAAIQRGRAVGVTVTTDPSDPVLERCVAVRVRSLRFPSYPALQVAKSTFVPLIEEEEESEPEPKVPERVPSPLPAATSAPVVPEPAAPPEPQPAPEAEPY